MLCNETVKSRCTGLLKACSKTIQFCDSIDWLTKTYKQHKLATQVISKLAVYCRAVLFTGLSAGRILSLHNRACA